MIRTGVLALLMSCGGRTGLSVDSDARADSDSLSDGSDSSSSSVSETITEPVDTDTTTATQSGTDTGPGCVAETCNAQDDDCDGEIDDAAPCPCPIEHRDGHAYQFCEGNTWAPARDDCRKHGYDLVTVNDEEEHVWLAGIVDSIWSVARDPRVWLGINDIEVEGDWRWANGATLDFVAWNESQPSDTMAHEDCGHLFFLHRDPKVPRWNDADCGFAYRYICEAE